MRRQRRPGRPSAKEKMRAFLKILAYPWFRYFGPRFSNLLLRLEEIKNQLFRMDERFDHMERSTSTHLETLTQFALNMQRTASVMDERAAALETMVMTRLTQDLIRTDPELADLAASAMVGAKLTDIGPGTAQLINWAASHRGASAQADLWFNPPVNVEVKPGEVVPTVVNERIVEIPFAMATAAALVPGSRVLDVGAAESTLALSLASLGLEVIAIDPRGYPLSHPNLQVVEDSVELWKGPDRPLDAIFCISTIEHLGVGAYGQLTADEHLDRLVMKRFASWLSDEGQVVLTTPYGRWSMDDFQRVYDSKHLEALLEGWTVLEKRVCAQMDDLRWQMVPEDSSQDLWRSDHRAVVLVRAVKAH